MIVKKYFNTQGICNPEEHYMVNLDTRLEEIKELVDRKQYFMINRARQYGKTTTLTALKKYLQKEYTVVSLDFQMFGNKNFESESIFVVTFVKVLLRKQLEFSSTIKGKLACLVEAENVSLFDLFYILSEWCVESTKPIILLIDEVDSATNNQVFLDFLAQLRFLYLERQKGEVDTFHSVILAGVHDIKNITLKMHPDRPMKTNSPWNIAADFDVIMSFSKEDISGMIKEYEKDYGIDVNIDKISQLIFDYTDGYPYLVSRVCKLIDENVSKKVGNKRLAWSENGFLQAINMLMNENNTLFSSLIHRLQDFEDIRKIVTLLLIKGQLIPYVATNEAIELAQIYGFVKKENMMVVISNRIFETVLYNHILSKEILGNEKDWIEMHRVGGKATD